MFKIIAILLCLSVFSTIFAQNQIDNSANAKSFIAALFKKDFAAAHNYFADAAKSQVPVEAMPQILAQLIGIYGEFRSIKEAKTSPDGKRVLVEIEFEKKTENFGFAFDDAGKIMGFRPAPPENAPKYETPNYANPASFEEQEVKVGSGEWTLPGTLTLPKGAKAVPAIVLVHGSGPNDRDETHINPANKIFKDLAWGLATKGIAVLRYDKRTRVHGLKLTDKLTINEETVDDAVLAVELLRKIPNIDSKRIFVLGHSLGGMAIPRIGAKDKTISGLIVFAGTARPLEDVILEQYYYLTSLDGDVSAEEKTILENTKTEVAVIKSLQANSLTGKKLIIAPDYYWFDLKNYDPPKLAKTLKQPMLVLQGESDYQVTMKDFTLWKNSLGKRKDVVFKTYPNLTHSFMDGLGGKPSPKDYDAVSHVKAIVIDDIANWILKGAKK